MFDGFFFSFVQGFGFSVPKVGSACDFSPAGYVTVLRSLLDLLRARAGPGAASAQFDLIFPCVSGHTAVLFAREHPSYIRRVVTLQTAAVADQLSWICRCDPGRVLATPHQGQAFNRTNARDICKQWFSVAAHRPEDAKAYHAIAQQVHRRAPWPELPRL
jgi:hypothetical protein